MSASCDIYVYVYTQLFIYLFGARERVSAGGRPEAAQAQRLQAADPHYYNYIILHCITQYYSIFTTIVQYIILHCISSAAAGGRPPFARIGWHRFPAANIRWTCFRYTYILCRYCSSNMFRLTCLSRMFSLIWLSNSLTVRRAPPLLFTIGWAL